MRLILSEHRVRFGSDGRRKNGLAGGFEAAQGASLYKNPPLLPERRTTVNDGTMLGRISLSRRENPLTLT